MRVPVEVRAFARSRRDDNGCIVWQGHTNRYGYGLIKGNNGKTRSVHRAVYEAVVGPIPSGLTLDHLCRNRACLNPDHLEPVTIAENVRRAAALKTHCPSGHQYSDDNTYITTGGHRSCRECYRHHAREYQRRKASERRTQTTAADCGGDNSKRGTAA